MQIIIEVDANKKIISVKDDAGNEKQLQSIIVCGGDAQSKKFYLFGWGSAADAAWALATGFNVTPDPFYKKVFVHFSRWIATFFGLDTKANIHVDAEELIKRWENEDSTNLEKDKSKWN